MLSLLVISDDLTGALDTGIQFAKQGIPTQIGILDAEKVSAVEETTSVLVVDTETRHATPEEAYRIVKNLVTELYPDKVRSIYIKTDSALRGNIGAVLSAASDAAEGKSVCFVPAYPAINRITCDGCQYIEGIPVAESSTGKDPFDPVKRSYIPELLADQTSKKVRLIPQNEAIPEHEKEIYVFDAQTQADMEQIAGRIKTVRDQFLLAGCAGFAAQLPTLLEMEPRENDFLNIAANKLLVVSGSKSRVSIEQCRAATATEAVMFSIRPLLAEYLRTGRCVESGDMSRQILKAFSGSDLVVLCSRTEEADAPEMEEETADAVRVAIPEIMGQIVRQILDSGYDGAILATGGDTFFGVMEHLPQSNVVPVYEMYPGVVVSVLKYAEKKYLLISKAGSFGDKDLYRSVLQMIQRGTRSII